MGRIRAIGHRRALIGVIAVAALALAGCVKATPPPTPAPPKAAFTSSAAPLVVSFTDQSTGSITGWSWDFGDSTTSSEQSPTHTYATHGDYTVALTVTGPGGSDTSTSMITVNPPAPVASFTSEPPSGTAPLTVLLTDTSTGVIADRAWDLNGDGLFDDATGPSATHTFDTAGEHTVGLKVTGPGGVATTTHTIGVTLPPPPVASFTAAPTSGEAPVTVNFADTSTGVVTGQSWDFESDGAVDATGPSASHIYTVAGNYPVTLTVTGPGGTASSTQTITVTVNTPPTVGITTPETGASFTTGSAVMFAGTASDVEDQVQPVLAWNSDINGPLGNGNSISVNSLSLGTHTITASATDSGGKTGTAKIIVKINPPPLPAPPVAAFSADVSSGNAPLAVNFKDASTGAITSWAWTFGDGGSATEQNPTHTFSTIGTHAVTLSVTGPGGTSTSAKSIVVNAPPSSTTTTTLAPPPTQPLPPPVDPGCGGRCPPRRM